MAGQASLFPAKSKCKTQAESMLSWPRDRPACAGQQPLAQCSTLLAAGCELLQLCPRDLLPCNPCGKNNPDLTVPGLTAEGRV